MNWIYVEDSLPNDGEIVIVYDGSPYAHGYGSTIQYGMYSSADKKWTVWLFSLDSNSLIFNESDWFIVTEWAKFPISKEY